MARHTIDDHRPGHIGRFAPKFAIDVIANAAGTQADGDQGRNKIGQALRTINESILEL